MNIHYVISEFQTDFFSFWHDEQTSYQQFKKSPCQIKFNADW